MWWEYGGGKLPVINKAENISSPTVSKNDEMLHIYLEVYNSHDAENGVINQFRIYVWISPKTKQ